MTTQQVVRETRSQGLARRVRGVIAEQRVEQRSIAKRLGISQPSLSRRVTGVQAFSVSEIETLAELLGVDEAYLYGFTMDRGFEVRGTPGYSTVAGATVVDLGAWRRARPSRRHTYSRPQRLADVVALADRRIA